MELHENTEKQERALLVAVDTGSYDVEASLAELYELTKTAGAEPFGATTQKRPSYDTATCVGSGMIEEIADICQKQEIDLLIFDCELSPTQIRNIEDITNVRVIDRTMLILDIFAARAVSKEGKLQVELAQLNYLLPRLSGRGAAMMQQKGGIGMRGPGERKLEYDRRRLRARITRLEKEIDQVKRERALRRRLRSSVPLPQIALIGYTNAGKSTLLNALANTNTVYADDKLFATLDPTTRRVPMRGGGQMLFTDTVGFIQKLPHALVSAFRATLEETAFADVLLHIHDASSPLRESQSRTVRQILTDLHIPRLPVIDVMNKTDLLPAPRLRALKEQYPQAVFISAQNKQGLTPLLAAVEKALQKKWKVYTLSLRADQTKLLGQIYTRCLVLQRTALPDGGLKLRLMSTEGNRQDLEKKLTAGLRP